MRLIFRIKYFGDVKLRIIKAIRRIFVRFKFNKMEPMSRTFGFDRGIPIDRVYIEKFLQKHASLICNNVCEVGDSAYSEKFGRNVRCLDVMNHPDSDSTETTIFGNLCDLSTLPHAQFDCFLCTQTLNFIYDYGAAIRGIHYVLVNGGVVLATVAGLCQVSRYDMDRWGDYWRFTNLSIQREFENVFGLGNVETTVFGNVFTAVAFLRGVSAEELPQDTLLFQDDDYQIIIAVKAIKK